MPKLNPHLIENNKSFETVQEIEKNEIKKSPLSAVARSKVVKKYGSAYVSEDRGSYGPCKNSSCDCSCSANECICNYTSCQESGNHFSISYSFKHRVDNEKYFFEESGRYSNS